MFPSTWLTLGSLVTAVLLTSVSMAARLVEVRTLDEEHVMITWQDSEVIYQDDGQGPTAFQGHESVGNDRLVKFGDPLDVTVAARPATYTIRSTTDPNYRAGLTPVKVFRRAKISGTAWKWPEPDVSMEHVVFLQLPKALKSGATYELNVAPGTRSDAVKKDFSFDSFKSETEALHVNLIGYHPDHTVMKSADLYAWLGDGGGRDYAKYAGRPVWLLNAKTGERHRAGQVTFWKKSAKEYGNWNLTGTDVWNCDFSSFKGTGTFRLAVEGIGVSPAFELRRDVYYQPFRTSVRGFYYMRIGEPKTLTPAPRQPRFLPGKDPEGFTVYQTTYGPFHPDWSKRSGDQWDVKDWSAYRLPGNPTNPNAYGGHSDALDWDRHPGHVSIIWDLLLPYLITNGKGGDDNLGILESGNGIPDVIDEAQNEVDLWLRLRDDEGNYASGLNNPSSDHKVMYQGAVYPFMAWVSAANCAILADAYRVAGKPQLMAKYRDAALEAWAKAGEQDLDRKHSIGNGAVRGRDLKQMAAAYLYNVTGEQRFEDVLVAETMVKTDTSPTEVQDQFNQLYATAAYLAANQFKVRPIRHPDLVTRMRAAVLHEARTKNVANTQVWPSRRSADTTYGWFQTITEVQRVCVAHAFAPNDADRNEFLRAMILEADYGLGRNVINSVLMTGLGSRHVEDIYTSGRNDGVPGVHPGHTPYMNAEPWGSGFMADPKWMANQGYPAWTEWPHGEAIWRARYCYANNEFTPQQSMRGKQCLLAYLYAIGTPYTAPAR